MAKGNLNLKALFTADTSGIKDGAKEATQSIKDFESGAGSVLDKFTGMFGTSFGDTGCIPDRERPSGTWHGSNDVIF